MQRCRLFDVIRPALLPFAPSRIQNLVPDIRRPAVPAGDQPAQRQIGAGSLQTGGGTHSWRALAETGTRVQFPPPLLIIMQVASLYIIMFDARAGWFPAASDSRRHSLSNVALSDLGRRALRPTGATHCKPRRRSEGAGEDY